MKAPREHPREWQEYSDVEKEIASAVLSVAEKIEWLMSPDIVYNPGNYESLLKHSVRQVNNISTHLEYHIQNGEPMPDVDKLTEFDKRCIKQLWRSFSMAFKLIQEPWMAKMLSDFWKDVAVLEIIRFWLLSTDPVIVNAFAFFEKYEPFLPADMHTEIQKMMYARKL